MIGNMKRIFTLILAFAALFLINSCKDDNGEDGVRAPLSGTYWEGTIQEDMSHADYKLKFNSDRDCELNIYFYDDMEGSRMYASSSYSGTYELGGRDGTIHFKNNDEPYDECEDTFQWGGDRLTLVHGRREIEMR